MSHIHGFNYCGVCRRKYRTYNMYGMGHCDHCGFDNKPHVRNEPERIYEFRMTHQIGREPAIVREVVGEPGEDWERDGIDDAIAAVFSAHESLSEATTLHQQAAALDKLSCAVSDLATWHPRWNIETGRIEESCVN